MQLNMRVFAPKHHIQEIWGKVQGTRLKSGSWGGKTTPRRFCDGSCFMEVHVECQWNRVK